MAASRDCSDGGDSILESEVEGNLEGGTKVEVERKMGAAWSAAACGLPGRLTPATHKPLRSMPRKLPYEDCDGPVCGRSRTVPDTHTIPVLNLKADEKLSADHGTFRG
jgi:hypothetical protein